MKTAEKHEEVVIHHKPTVNLKSAYEYLLTDHSLEFVQTGLAVCTGFYENFKFAHTLEYLSN